MPCGRTPAITPALHRAARERHDTDVTVRIRLGFVLVKGAALGRHLEARSAPQRTS